MWLSSIRGSLIKASVKQGKADRPGSLQQLIAPFPCIATIQRWSIICINKEGQILRSVSGGRLWRPAQWPQGWGGLHHFLNWLGIRAKWGGAAKRGRRGFEEGRKPLTTACGLQPLQEGPTGRVIPSFAVTARHICLPKACPVPCLPPRPMAEDGFTAEGSTAIRQRSQGGLKRQTCAFPLPSCYPYPQHPPQAPLPRVNIMPGLSLPSGISQLMGRGGAEGSLWTSVRTEHPFPLVPRDGETKLKPSPSQGFDLPEGLWLFLKGKYKTMIASG